MLQIDSNYFLYDRNLWLLFVAKIKGIPLIFDRAGDRKIETVWHCLSEPGELSRNLMLIVKKDLSTIVYKV
jgi:hypothetical protein